MKAYKVFGVLIIVALVGINSVQAEENIARTKEDIAKLHKSYSESIARSIGNTKTGQWIKLLDNRDTLVAAVAASFVARSMCPNGISSSTENIVFMMNVHGFGNDEQFQREINNKGIENISSFSRMDRETAKQVKEGMCLYANLVNTYANDLYKAAEKLLNEASRN